jgi:hypothetical protein
LSGFRQFAAQKLGPLNPLPSHLPEIAMAKPRKIQTKTPGVIEPEAAAPVPEAEAPAAVEAIEAGGEAPPVIASPAEDTATVTTSPEADAPVDAVETVADDDAGADDLVQENVEEEVAAAPVRKELPDQSEVDAKAITKPVLTKQGWVVPA